MSLYLASFYWSCSDVLPQCARKVSFVICLLIFGYYRIR